MKAYDTVRKIFRLYGLSIAVLIILGIGAYLRLYRISEYLTFLGDEGRDVLVVKRMIVDHKFTLLGPTASVGGFFLGPIYYYFMMPFLWLWKFDPTGPAVMVALLGVATIYLIYKVGKEMVSPMAGLVASSLYALSPVVIAYSRSSWNPNVVPFFSILLLYFSWKIAVRKKRFDALWIGILLGIGIQLHYLFLFLYCIVFLWGIFGVKRSFVTLVDIFYLACGVIIGASGFLLFEVRHGFPNTISIINFILTGKDTGFSFLRFIGNITDVSTRLFGRLILHLPDQAALRNMNALTSYSWVGAMYVSTCIGLTYLIVTVVKNRKKLFAAWSDYRSQLNGKEVAYLLTSIWIFGVIFLFGLYKRDIYDYYFGIVFPVPFLIFGFIADRVWNMKSIWKWVFFVIWLGLIILNWQGRPFLYPPNNQLRQMETIARTALAKTDDKPYNFALVAPTNSDHAYRYFFEIWGKPPVTIENVANDPTRQTVTDQLIVICEDSGCQPLGHSLWEIAGFGRAEIAGEWEVPFVKIFRLVHYTGK